MSKDEWKEEDFGSKLEKAIQAVAYPKEDTQQLLGQIQDDEITNALFDNLSALPDVKRILFLHRFDLFGEEGAFSPYLFLCNISGSKIQKEYGSRALKQIVHINPSIIRKEINNCFPREEWDGIVVDIKDIIIYFLVLAIRENPILKDLVNGDSFDYSVLKRYVKDYSELGTIEDYILSLLSDFEADTDRFDPTIKKKIQDTVILVISRMVGNLPDILEMTSTTLPNTLLTLHEESEIRVNNLMKVTNLTYKEYQDILDALHLHHTLENKSTILWCGNCNMEHKSSMQYNGNITPSKLIRINCPNCSKKQSFASAFSFHPLLKRSMLSKDGLLSVYFAWLLTNKGVDYCLNQYSSKFENDFVIENSILVECKMFKSEKDSGAIASEIKNSIAQIKKHASQLRKDGIIIEKTYILWNRYDLDEEWLEDIMQKQNKTLKGFSVDLIDPENIEDFCAHIRKQ